MSHDKLRVVVIDDSYVYRRIVRKVLGESSYVEVAGIAPDGQLALEVIDVTQPDLITLDVEMPVLDGIGVLKELKARNDQIGTIMVSCLTEPGAEATMAALKLGAFDFVLKPDKSSQAANREQLRRDLLPKVEAFAQQRRLNVDVSTQASKPHRPKTAPNGKPTTAVGCATKQTRSNTELVAIGVSTGGPEALAKLLPLVPASFPIPIVVVQHMPPMFTRTLANSLNSCTALNVVEGQHDAELVGGHIYLAPGGKQMKIVRRAKGNRLCVNDDPPRNSCRPSVDYLFESAADTYGGAVAAVVLTGMGNDGTEGCRALKSRGAHVVVQDRESSVVFGMPRCVIEAGLADEIAPLEEIANSLKSLVTRTQLCS